ncbi:MAG: CHAT domain-containing protein [Pseudomonadota bacterium]
MLKKILFSLLLMTNSHLIAASDSQILLQGDELGEAQQVTIYLSPGEAKVIRANQISSDVLLQLVSPTNQKIVRELSLEATFALDEILFVSSKDCTKCVINLRAARIRDQSSPFKLEAFGIPENNISEFTRMFAEYETANRISQTAAAKTSALASQHLLNAIEAARRLGELDLQAFFQVLRSQLLIEAGKDHLAVAELKDLRESPDPGLVRYKVIALLVTAAVASKQSSREFLTIEAINAARKHELPFLLSEALSTRANILVANGRATEAFPLYREALNNYAKLENNWAMAVTLYNLSWSSQKISNSNAALAYNAQLRALTKKSKDKENAIWALYDLGRIHADLADGSSANTYFNQALTTISANPGAGASVAQLEASIYLEMARQSRLGGTLYQAKDYVVQSKSLFEFLSNKTELFYAIYEEANIELANGQLDSALALYQQVLDSELARGRFRDAALTHMKLAEVFMARNEYIESALHQTESLKAFSELGDKRALLKSVSQAGELLYHLDAVPRGLEVLDQALELARNVVSKDEMAELQYRRAEGLFQLGELPQAQTAIVEAIETVSSINSKVGRKDLQRHYHALQKDLFALRIEIQLALGSSYTIEALRVAESYRANTLRLRSLYSAKNAENLRVDTARAELLRKLRDQALGLYSASNISAETITSETRKMLSSLREINYQEQSDVIVRRVPALTTNQIGKLLKANNEVIILYFLHERNSWAWVIEFDDLRLYKLRPASEIETLTRAALQHIQTPPSERKGSGAWAQKEALSEIASAVWWPLLSELKGSASKITLLTDGVLNSLPFAAMPLPASNKPTITAYELNFMRSLSQIIDLESVVDEQWMASELNALIVADPFFPDSIINGALVNDDGERVSLPRIPYSRIEGTNLAKRLALSNRLLVGADATKENFVHYLHEPYSIIHLATHGLTNRYESSLSALVFTANKRANSLLLLPEISDLPIKSQLVVLSACDSYSGQAIDGEGVFGLTRAFLEAGAHQVVGSLWSVDDVATSRLMGEFYRSLLDDRLSVAHSLRTAQLAIYTNKDHNWKDPYYWAAFLLEGNGGPLVGRYTKQ